MTADIISKVEEALEKVRLFLREDGGDIELKEVTENMVALVEFKGSCKDCLMNKMTFKTGIEESILTNVPQIKSVEVVEK